MAKYLDIHNNKSKIQLETATHPCPKCKRPDGVQLTRFKHEITVLKRTISLPNNMSVKYACKYCSWRKKALPDDDPFFHIFNDVSSIGNYFNDANHKYYNTDNDYSIMITSSIDRPAILSLLSRSSVSHQQR
ncbi:hypothetical protein BDF20DRAFT_840898 [Mycotypha africana]|uniref:uncharacterized protein n=1 Tax=Mycotypha africana TaxID=64632 RepID=UPI0023007866|nr:uncharacterized protein BDF20DRAFT_840898 [Mycotypha africana]KAI8990803.1 hypothetical protein BDF20DRAFT_840898 [Mycotypha africana]